jgi:hypothetical protein
LNVEKALRERTVKFLYVLSRASNSKDGPLNELQVASNVARDNALHDFIIPLAIDDLPSRQTHIQLSRLNHISFRHSWADGLHVLFELLDRENVKKDEERFGAKAVSEWWRSNSPVDQGVRQENEMHVSNWFTEYRKKHDNKPPNELFIHSRVRFEEREWHGFREAAGKETNVVGVRIKHESDLRIYRRGDQPILRGLAYLRDERTGYLWTKGFIPRLQTYPGMEVPSPLLLDICKGYADIRVVRQDLMALTKLNYNACIFADGLPVTLRFADAVGEILTSGPMANIPPLPFKHYI